MSSVVTDNASVLFRVASLQSGADNAAAFISGDVKIIYAGGYSKAPTITLQ